MYGTIEHVVWKEIGDVLNENLEAFWGKVKLAIRLLNTGSLALFLSSSNAKLWAPAIH